MISNEKYATYKVVYLIKIYNFGFGNFSIQVCLNNLMKIKFQDIKTSNKILGP
jgi:hypothetical protein